MSKLPATVNPPVRDTEPIANVPAVICPNSPAEMLKPLPLLVALPTLMAALAFGCKVSVPVPTFMVPETVLIKGALIVRLALPLVAIAPLLVSVPDNVSDDAVTFAVTPLGMVIIVNVAGSLAAVRLRLPPDACPDAFSVNVWSAVVVVV